MKPYGVLVIGCGHIGCEHMADIYFREDIRLLAVADSREELAQQAARRYGAPAWGTDYRAFLADERIDIVIIATYTSSHLPILKDCLAAGKHVLCEKPIAATWEDGRAFYECVKQTDRKVLVAHVLRHNRSYIRVRELIRGGAIGTLRLARMVQNHHAMDWARYKRLLEDTSPLVDCGVHYIDVLQWFTGSSIVEVSGMETFIDPGCGHPNYGMMTLRLQNGCIGYYEAGWSRCMASQNLKEFIGDKGRITLELKDNRAANREEGDLITVYSRENGEYRTINLQSTYKDMYGQLRALIDSIETDAPMNPTIDEVYSAFRVAMTAEQAIRENTILRVKDA